MSRFQPFVLFSLLRGGHPAQSCGYRDGSDAMLHSADAQFDLQAAEAPVQATPQGTTPGNVIIDTVVPYPSAGEVDTVILRNIGTATYSALSAFSMSYSLAHLHDTRYTMLLQLQVGVLLASVQRAHIYCGFHGQIVLSADRTSCHDSTSTSLSTFLPLPPGAIQ